MPEKKPQGRPTKAAEIEALKAKGKTPAEIAEALGVSIRTIRRHGEKMSEKGRPRRTDPAEVMALKEKGYTVGMIANRLSVSESTVNRALKAATLTE